MIETDVAVRPVIDGGAGAAGMVAGVTVGEGVEKALQPATFRAFTENVYAVPFESPDISHEVVGEVQILDPG